MATAVPQTRLVLGGVLFRDFEVPEEISFGMNQRLKIHDVIGSGQIIDAMGPRPEPIKWRGRFRGRSALGRAQSLRSMCERGAVVALSWGGMSYRVVIEKFEPNYQKFQEIPYDITCIVVSEGGGGALAALAGSLSQIIAADIGDLVALGGGLS